MALLLFHFFENGFFLHFDEVSSFFLAKAEPEFLDAFTFLC
jgi:hypothetical protein